MYSQFFNSFEVCSITAKYATKYELVSLNDTRLLEWDWLFMCVYYMLIRQRICSIPRKYMST